MKALHILNIAAADFSFASSFKFGHMFGDIKFFRRANNKIHTAYRCDTFRFELRIATGNHDSR